MKINVIIRAIKEEYMYVIQLDTTVKQFYKAVFDEGFRITQDIEEATMFQTEAQARIIVESYAVQQLYQSATIKAIKKLKGKEENA